MKQRHGEGDRLFPGSARLEARGIEITEATALLSTFTGPGQFGLLFPDLNPFRPTDAQLMALGKAMEDANFRDKPEPKAGDHPSLPAGYTYLGQFVDHDITFDKMRSIPPQAVDPATLKQARTPALDLDSLYGLGPETDQGLYQLDFGPDHARFKIGATRGEETAGDQLLKQSLPHDLFRNAEGAAVIADERNDENVVIAQLHLAFQRFHNKVLDGLAAGTVASAGGDTPFEQARRLVRWHYQWIVWEDFLPRIVDPAVLQRVRKEGRKHYQWDVASGPYMPLEFSVAAYRMGHSLIRQSYEFNRVFSTGSGEGRARLHQLLLNTGPGVEVPLETKWIIDWQHFFSLDPAVSPNPSRRLDTVLANPLGELMRFVNTSDLPASLAQRNLLRGSRLGLPSGQDVAKHLGIPPLTKDELSTGKTGDAAATAELVEQTPLWFYILKEAEMRESGERLGPVGSLILAEVFVGLLEGDPESFFRADSPWVPTLGPVPGQFTMADLLRFVGYVNPLGK